ncbi:MAG: helix-turn-helix domain-containing protein [Nanoarchaeota archaeon]
MIKPELVKKIKDYFDLNIYETKVWLALLSKGLVSAGETAEISGVPRSRTYDVLESLAKRGFAIIKIGKPVKYIAVEPKVILEKMKMHVMNEANDKVKLLGTLKGMPEYAELEELHKTGISPVKAEDLSGFVRGRSNILPKLRELLIGAQKEITIHTTVEDFESKSRVLGPTLEKLQNSNIKLKISLVGAEDKVRKVASRNNLKIKQSDKMGRFFVADKSEMLFMINPESADEDVAIWLNAPFFIDSFTGMYDSMTK